MKKLASYITYKMENNVSEIADEFEVVNHLKTSQNISLYLTLFW